MIQKMVTLLQQVDKDLENDCKASEALLFALSDQQIMGLFDKSSTKTM